MTRQAPSIYYKAIASNYTHYGLVYALGVNVDPVPFNPSGSCQPGGMYFTTIDQIKDYLEFGAYVATIRLCDDSLVYKDPVMIGSMKTNKFEILSFGGFPLHAASIGGGGLVLSRLEKANVFLWSCSNGHIETVKTLVEGGVDGGDHVTRCEALSRNLYGFRNACKNGHLMMAKWITAVFRITRAEAMENFNEAFYWTCVFNHLELAKWLADEFSFTRDDVIGGSNNNNVFSIVCGVGHLEVAKWLVSEFSVSRKNVLKFRNSAFSAACCKGHLDVAKWLVETFAITREDVIDRLTYEGGSVFNSVCKSGHLEVVKWLVGTFSITRYEASGTDGSTIRDTCENGHLEIAKWLMNELCH